MKYKILWEFHALDWQFFALNKIKDLLLDSAEDKTLQLSAQEHKISKQRY